MLIRSGSNKALFSVEEVHQKNNKNKKQAGAEPSQARLN